MADQDARTGYNASELICVMSARALKNRDVVFGGAGLPLVSAILAQNTHAPGAPGLVRGGGEPGAPASCSPSRTSSC